MIQNTQKTGILKGIGCFLIALLIPFVLILIGYLIGG